MIRAMTTQEVRAALRQGAVRCIDSRTPGWWSLDVLLQDGAYEAANSFYSAFDSRTAESPEHAALFLMFCAEAQ